MTTMDIHTSDRWIARGVSVALHGLLVLLLARNFSRALKSSPVVFSVETVSGFTPQGEGSGAEGATRRISDVPANANPLAAGLRLQVEDAPVPPATAQRSKTLRPRPVAAAPSMQDLAKRDESLNIGLKPRQSRGAEEPSEGGMGNARQAGAPGGALDLQGPIAGRGYHIGDYSFGKPLPGESEVLIGLEVSPKGEVVSAAVKRTSGYPELDQHALAKAREIVFDGLASGVPQETSSGTVLFKFEFTGRSKP